MNEISALIRREKREILFSFFFSLCCVKTKQEVDCLENQDTTILAL